MAAKHAKRIDCRHVELDGVRYVIVRESIFNRLCERAHVKGPAPPVVGPTTEVEMELDGATLAEKLLRRRLAARLSQAELARRASVRPETLNRIERGHTTPDFATIRKLLVAMNAAEEEIVNKSLS
jgi:DNA-binding XRE family transcriptional regulator